MHYELNLTVILLTSWPVWVVAGAVIGHSKGRVRAGTLWAFFLGALGVLIAAAFMPNRREAEREARAWADVLAKANEVSPTNGENSQRTLPKV